MAARARPNVGWTKGTDGPVVGVVGGGQLARMTHQAAIALGVDLRVLAAAPNDSAARVAPSEVGRPDDARALAEFAAGCDVVTFDHELVPGQHLQALVDSGVVCRPAPAALVYAQDKERMRARLAGAGIPVPEHAVVTSPAALADFAGRVTGWPVVAKTVRGGYDGRGVWTVARPEEAAAPFTDSGAPNLLIEERVEFVRELAALVARAPSGQAVAYPVVESVQRAGICVEVVAPAPGLDPGTAAAAQRVALNVAAELDVTGVLAVELFELTDGGVLVNELAMRPHNTGHWSIDAAVTSQFENHLRAVLDLPLGSPQARSRWTVMTNVLGGEVGELHTGLLHCLARDPGLRVHLYGKQVRPGRKVGHVTAYGDDLHDVRDRARHAAAYLRGDIDG